MPSHLPKLASHLNRVAEALAAMEGVPPTAMWPAVLDTRTGRYPEGDQAPKRVYRLIGAPRGSTLYWDQPLAVAAEWLAAHTGIPAFAEAVDRYVDAFLDRCVAPNGLFQWGNHIYYDVFEARVIGFHGGCHELRPITPAWELFWRRDAERTERYLRLMIERHLFDPASGGFNRHDDGKMSHAFIEAGGILAESAAWLYGKTGDRAMLDLGLRIAGYSFGHRGPATGLVVNQPDQDRWDARVCTTEVGVWAQSLLRAAEYTGEAGFTDMAGDAVRAYLEHGYDSATGRYFGQLSVTDGSPVAPASPGYWPRYHADPWNTDQWPTHDYPMAVAEACLTLHAATGEEIFLEAIHRWAAIASEATPESTGAWTYAENYGRAIHFLARAGRELGIDAMAAAAAMLADEAVGCLYENGLFQGYPGGHVYESVDGVGFLALALLALDAGDEPSLLGFGF